MSQSVKSENPVQYQGGAPVLSEDFAREEEVLREAHNILVKRMLRESAPMTSPDLIGKALCLRIGGNYSESLGIVYLDTQHRMIALEELFQGSADGCSISMAHILRRCVFHNAQAIFLYHNHPSGVTFPSKADIKTTQSIITALKLIDVSVLDHIIVAGTEYESLRNTTPTAFSI